MDVATHSRDRESVAVDRCLITRIVIQNYKSIVACDVRLGPLSFLVGPNGSGKSNFLDAFALVGESLRHSIDAALYRRGGYHSVCWEIDDRVKEFGIRLECKIKNLEAQYSFTVRSDRGDIRINKEVCRVVERGSSTNIHFYIVENGQVISSSMKHHPAVYTDRLFLVSISGSKCFRAVFEALSSINVYKINPDLMRKERKQQAGIKLRRDGANIASVIHSMEKNEPNSKALIDRYMQKIAPGIQEVRCVDFPGISKTSLLLFIEITPDGSHYPFTASQVSSGTLRALGILTTLFQNPQINGQCPSFIAIEQPEDGLHLAAFGALLDSLRYASKSSQIVVSSHSSDLLDHKKIPAESILAVSRTEQRTRIGAIDEAGRSAIREQLFTAGELLRANALQLPFDRSPSGQESIDLFEGME